MQVWETVRFGEFELDLSRHELRRGGQPVKLQNYPSGFSRWLVEAEGRVLSGALFALTTKVAKRE